MCHSRAPVSALVVFGNRLRTGDDADQIWIDAICAVTRGSRFAALLALRVLLLLLVLPRPLFLTLLNARISHAESPRGAPIAFCTGAPVPTARPRYHAPVNARYDASVAGSVTTLRDRAAGAEAQIDAALGNNVLRFRAQPRLGAAAVDVLVPPGVQGLRGYRAGNPLLFPFPNRVQGGRFSFNGHDVVMDVNETARGNRIHGLVFDRAFEVEGVGADAEGAYHRAFLDLHLDAALVRQFPWPCRFSVETRLVDGALLQRFEAQNCGNQLLPMGFGTHPWFPNALGGSRGKTVVCVPGDRRWTLADGVPTGETVEVEGGKFDLRAGRALGEEEYDDVLTDPARRADGWTEASIRYGDVAITISASGAFREWVIFAPLSRPVICLEPYTCTTDAVHLAARGVDSGLITLAPGARWEGTIVIRVS